MSLENIRKIFYKLSNEEAPPMNKVVVYNQEDFEEHIKNGLLDTEAYIDIYSGPYGKPCIEHESENVISPNFEDMPANVRFPGEYQPTNPTITKEDAERLVLFIEENAKKKRDFIIHCAAGVSRSQQVASYILLTKSLFYEYDNSRSTHGHYHYHTIVLSRLLAAKHKILPDFHNLNDEFVYDENKDEWVEK